MNIENGVQPYMNVLQFALVEGDQEIFDSGLELLSILINHTDDEFMEPFAAKILGILVRVLNYKKEAYVKKKIIDMIDFFQDQPASQLFVHQIVFTYISLLDTRISTALKPLVKSLIDHLDYL